jgi:hypothetical protein
LPIGVVIGMLVGCFENLAIIAFATASPASVVAAEVLAPAGALSVEAGGAVVPPPPDPELLHAASTDATASAAAAAAMTRRPPHAKRLE